MGHLPLPLGSHGEAMPIASDVRLSGIVATLMHTDSTPFNDPERPRGIVVLENEKQVTNAAQYGTWRYGRA
jgi:hypothetical protein